MKNPLKEVTWVRKGFITSHSSRLWWSHRRSLRQLVTLHLQSRGRVQWMPVLTTWIGIYWPLLDTLTAMIKGLLIKELHWLPFCLYQHLDVLKKLHGNCRCLLLKHTLVFKRESLPITVSNTLYMNSSTTISSLARRRVLPMIAQLLDYCDWCSTTFKIMRVHCVWYKYHSLIESQAIWLTWELLKSCPDLLVSHPCT